MCLTCGCMDAHREMGTAKINYKEPPLAGQRAARVQPGA